MRILIVEDDIHMARAIQAALTRHESTIACTQNQALAYIEKPWDLYILDVNLPDGDGIDVCRWIRAHSSAPVFLISADGSLETILKGYENLADDYIEKPFDLTVFRAKIQALERRVSSQKILQLPAGRLDLDGGVLEYNGMSIELTATQAALLKVLAEKKTVSYESLCHAVFSASGHLPSEQTLRVRMCELKKKLKPVPLQIVNLRNTGYRLEAA